MRTKREIIEALIKDRRQFLLQHDPAKMSIEQIRSIEDHYTKHLEAANDPRS